MTDLEIINGNDEICIMLQFKSTKAYVYEVPNLFPFEKEYNTGWIETDVQAIQFHVDWNMLIGAYNRALYILNNMPETARQLLKQDKNYIVNFGVKNFFSVFEGQLNISSCWIKLVDFAKWWNSMNRMLNSVKEKIKTKNQMNKYRKRPIIIEAIQWTGNNLKEIIDFSGLHESAKKLTWEEYELMVIEQGLKIFTLEGKMNADVNDFIIKGIHGEFYPCKPDIFEKTYEKIES